jgi:hypothetical protein
MNSRVSFQQFLGSIMAEAGTIPAGGLAACAAQGIVSAALDLVFWTSDGQLTLADYSSFAVLVGSSLAAGYVAVTTMIRVPRSVGAAGSFVAANLMMMAPLIAGLGVLIYVSKYQFNGMAVTAALGLLTAGLIVFALLPAWPVAAVASGRVSSPVRVLAATAGHRWALMGVFFVASSLNRVVPGLETSTSKWEAVGLSLVGGVMSAISLMLAVSTGVAAWRAADSQDGRSMAV